MKNNTGTGNKKEKTKILAYSHSPKTHTGFGTVIFELVRRLQDTQRYDISILGINDYGDPSPLDGRFKVYPMQGDPSGLNRLVEVFLREQPDIFLTLNDLEETYRYPSFVLDARQKLDKRIPWVGYFPIDGTPIHPECVEVVRQFIDKPVVISEWGAKQFRNESGMDIPYIWHGVDTNRFKPMSEEEKKEMIEKEFPKLKDKFVVSCVGYNQLRKQYNLLLEAFKIFSKNKSDVALYLHTTQVTPLGWNIPRMAKTIGLDETDVFYTQGVREAFGIHWVLMNKIYNIADVFFLPSVGEGFGLPFAEAQACGVPIVTQDCSSITEVVGDAGIMVKPKGHMFFPHDYDKKRPMPSPKDLAKALDRLYEDEDLRKNMGAIGRERTTIDERFSWDFAARKFDKIFTELMEQSSSFSIKEVI